MIATRASQRVFDVIFAMINTAAAVKNSKTSPAIFASSIVDIENALPTRCRAVSSATHDDPLVVELSLIGENPMCWSSARLRE